MEHFVKIFSIEKISKNVKRFRIEKPRDYKFVSGQHVKFLILGTDVKRLFSISSPAYENYLEFMARIHEDREGGTKQFDNLKISEELMISDASGKIKYIGNGIFIAGGIGISPLVSILRDLNKQKKLEENKLFYMDKTKDDLVLDKELKNMLGENVVFTLTRERTEGYLHGKIDKKFLEEHIENFNQKFYLCGPAKFVLDIKKSLVELGAKKEEIVSEF